MRLGAIHLWGDDLARFRREVTLSEELGFEVVGIGDSPAGWRDMDVSMAVAAMDTKRAIIAPMVTSPFLRHPLVSASAMSTLQSLSGGRMALGLATGGSTIMALGRPPASMDYMRRYIEAHRALFRGEPISWEGREIHELRLPEDMPIYFSTFGPKGMQLAGEVCDGAILFTGSDLGPLKQKMDLVRGAAKAAGRDPDKLKFWVGSYCSIRPTRAEAVDDLKAFLVVNGMAVSRMQAVLDQVPTQFRGKLVELGERYDPSEHVVVGGKNVDLMDELGLTEFLSQFETIVGPPEEVSATLKEMEALGVDTFFACLPGNADREGTLRRLSEAAGRS
jgi:alkanesulfonate monooxygenase SsuD/methylene tetrahydromethanopterin reductase-like flavin-dependent oxidoreductase (luciferase family)